MTSYSFRGFTIPDHMFYALRKYVTERRPVGHFLTAVICNDLREAVSRADDENLANLPAYVGYLYNDCPSQCWGSKKKMDEWLYPSKKEGA